MGQHVVREDQANLTELIDRALAGEEVVIERDGRPVVEVRVVSPSEPEAGHIVRWSTDEMLAWLDERRVRPLQPPTMDAGEFVSRMRDEEWR
jgi:antitoxin (DNA-binding transcriptional repressor) of toxin-antitoxin stability system